MQDYIDVLLESLEAHDQEYLDWKYFVQSERTFHAMEALEKTLSAAQKKLFEDYEEKRDAAAAIYGTALARQAFLLAKEIYR